MLFNGRVRALVTEVGFLGGVDGGAGRGFELRLELPIQIERYRVMETVPAFCEYSAPLGGSAHAS